MTEKKIYGLTKYPSASFLEVLTLALPLMLAGLSAFLMNFCDRLILSQYSTDAMNAAVTAGMTAYVFTYGALGLALIAEVFVAKLYGAGEFHYAARPVWQMIWFSLVSSVVFVPLAFMAQWLVPTKQFGGEAVGYFQVLIFFGALYPLTGALSAFFIGIGRVKVITIVTIVANIVNIGLDYVLVFGMFNFPELGTKGAALGTVVAQFVQIICLFAVFFSSVYRQQFGTLDYKFRKDIFWQCVRIGGPTSVGGMVEISAWALILRLMTEKGEAYVTTLAIGQNLHLLFSFMSQGLQKAVISIAANLMGQENHVLMSRLIRSALMLLAVIAAILFIPLAIYPDPLVEIFLIDELKSQYGIFDVARKTGVWVWLFIMMDTAMWAMAGVLTAYGDTKFIMLNNALTAWCCAVVPTYLLINKMGISPHYTWVIINFYGFLSLLLTSWRVGFQQNLRRSTSR